MLVLLVFTRVAGVVLVLLVLVCGDGVAGARATGVRVAGSGARVADAGDRVAGADTWCWCSCCWCSCCWC